MCTEGLSDPPKDGRLCGIHRQEAGVWGMATVRKILLAGGHCRLRPVGLQEWSRWEARGRRKIVTGGPAGRGDV